MGQTLPNGIYLPAEGERNCYDGLEGNWRSLDGLISTVSGKASASHYHGNITNDGKVGTTANLPLITGTGGAVQAGAFGNQANTFCEGNDSRLSDARTPVAHTHLTADVTDLLNTSHEWTKEQICDEGFTSKSTTMERCVIPATVQHINFTFKDKNNKGIGAIRRYFRNSGEQQIQIFGNTRIKDGQYDETGSDEFFGFSEVIHPDGTKYFSFDGYLNNSIRPRLTNTYQLGDSSYQWASIYAQSYYYNGTAWGLDKANVWTGRNTYTTAEIILKNDYVARGTIPSVNRNYILNFADSNNETVGMIFQQIRTGSGSYKMTFSLNNGTTDHRINFFGFTDGSSFFIPEVTNTTDLGSSTNKWKSLNGINPGALSLPDMDSTVSKTTALATAINKTQTANSWTADFTGILSITWFVKNLTGPFRCSVYNNSDIRYATWGQTFSTNDAWYFIVSFPVQNGKTYYFDNSFTRTSEDTSPIVYGASAVYCLGNV